MRPPPFFLSTDAARCPLPVTRYLLPVTRSLP